MVRAYLPTYLDEFGGERAGVPKGNDIPFPAHKVRAAVALLAYGAPKYETLTAIARTVRVGAVRCYGFGGRKNDFSPCTVGPYGNALRLIYISSLRVGRTAARSL